MIDIAADGLPDDRITCATCRNLIPWSGKCREQERYGAVLKDLPCRCIAYSPLPQVKDQRTGAQRWPTLTLTIAEVRKLDERFEAAKA